MTVRVPLSPARSESSTCTAFGFDNLTVSGDERIPDLHHSVPVRL